MNTFNVVKIECCKKCFRMFSKWKGYRRLKEERTEDEEKKYQDYKDNWVKKADGKGCKANGGYTQDEKKNENEK